MRRLIAIFAAGVFLSVAGLASAEARRRRFFFFFFFFFKNFFYRHSADRPDARPPRRGHWFAGTVTAVGAELAHRRRLWTGPNDGSLNGQTVTVAVETQTRINQGRTTGRSPSRASARATSSRSGPRGDDA